MSMGLWNFGKSLDDKDVATAEEHVDQAEKRVNHRGFGALMRSRLAVMSFIGIVCIPTLVYGTYLVAYATPQYSSEFRVLIRRAAKSDTVGFPQVMGLSIASQSSEDSYAVIQYLESEQAVSDLDRLMGIRKLYSSSAIDYFSRLARGATNYQLTKYWNNKLNAYYENTTTTVVVRVTAFSPETSNQLARRVLSMSEGLVNKMSARSQTDMVSYAQKDVETTEAALRKIESRLFALRNERGIIDPRRTAAANLERQGQIQAEITAVRAELATRQNYLDQSSPVIQVIQRRLTALNRELNRISAESTTRLGGQAATLSGAINAFEQLEADQTFAQKSYQAALAALTSARADQARQHLYLDTVVQPNIPDERSYPDIPKNIGLFVLFASALWILAFLLTLSIRERT